MLGEDEFREGLAFDGPARTKFPADAKEAADPGRLPCPRAEDGSEVES